MMSVLLSLYSYGYVVRLELTTATGPKLGRIYGGYIIDAQTIFMLYPNACDKTYSKLAVTRVRI